MGDNNEKNLLADATPLEACGPRLPLNALPADSLLTTLSPALNPCRYNTAAMMAAYYGQSINFSNRIDWNPSDPNVLRLSMPGGLAIRTRVTRRSEAYPEPSRIETSEYVEQIFDDPGAAAPRVKASQCFTKYKFRREAAAAADNGPVVVATQVVSDYLTPYDGEELYFKAMNRPVAQYTYKMAFVRLPKSVAAL